MSDLSCHMLVWFQVNNLRIRVGEKGLGHIMTHNDTVSLHSDQICRAIFIYLTTIDTFSRIILHLGNIQVSGGKEVPWTQFVFK